MKTFAIKILFKIKKIIKQSLIQIRKWLLKPVIWQLDQHESALKILSDANFRMRATLKRAVNKPINVLFVCHEPALWSMFETVYNAMSEDQAFNPLVVVLPYRHWTLPEGHYKDAGMLEVCKLRKIKAISGHDKEKNEWLNPVSLMPDYVFFQTPYALYSNIWSVEHVSIIAKVCYIPYGTVLFKGEVDQIAHPASFFCHASLIFKESGYQKELFIEKFKQKNCINQHNVILSGYPKLDYVYKKNLTGKVWRRGMQSQIRRILWTPRWTTSEGNSHFFDYKDFFINFCKEQECIDFVFRPHPLCLQNFINTGELTDRDLSRMEKEYENSINMTLDKTESYQDTFLTSDILISDISSMMFEYFATGKPIVYTHRIDMFNELGQKLSEGFYWVKNANELKQTLEMLISGNDPLHDIRQEIIKKVLFIPQGGAGLRIKELLLADFNSTEIIKWIECDAQ